MKRLDGVKKILQFSKVMENGDGYEEGILMQGKPSLRPTLSVISNFKGRLLLACYL